MSSPPRMYRYSAKILLMAAFVPVALAAADPTASPALGGEIATYSLTEHWRNAPQSNYHYRQDICKRYDQFSSGEIELRDALSGLSLSALVARGEFFNYDSNKGIDPDDPGMLAEIMDAVAERANFTWRNSFAVYEQDLPAYFNMTWTQFLFRTIEDFDIAVDWYANSIERMEMGAAFVEPWYDNSLIMIDQVDPPEPNHINYSNWAKPFEAEVWTLTLITIVMSAFVYQVIEFLNGEREDRTMFQWFSDNLYLSSLNSTQNFEYAPNSVAGRVFGVSMGVWALIMAATYTANLASLFVEEQKPALQVESIEQAIVLGTPICTWAGTFHEAYIRQKYRNAILVPKPDQLSMFRAVRSGECGLTLAAKDSWHTFARKELFNPDCDLEWTGRVVKSMRAGFALKADAGDLCTSFIRDVFNLHLVEYINDGGLDRAWDEHRTKTQDKNCNAEVDDDDATGTFAAGLRRHLQQINNKALAGTTTESATSSLSGSRRRLKGNSNTSATASSTNGKSMSLDQMLGTFFLHWAAMGFAILLSLAVSFYDKWERDYLAKKNMVREKQSFRKHGPIVGMPPRMNTFVIRNVSTRNVHQGTSIKSLQDTATRDESCLQVSQQTASTMSISKSNHIIGSSSRQRLQSSDSTTDLSVIESVPEEPASVYQEYNVDVRDAWRDEGDLAHNERRIQGASSMDDSGGADRMELLGDKMSMILSLLQQQSECIDRQARHIEKQDDFIREVKQYMRGSQQAPDGFTR